MKSALPDPTNPVSAATHPDPYPYYAQLRSGPAFTYNEELRLWVASTAAALDTAFAHPGLRVRPLAEPVPAAISAGPAGEIFGQLVRMTDGEPQQRAKRSLERALGELDTARMANTAAATALAGAGQTASAEGLNNWIFSTPVMTVAALVGFRTEGVAQYLADFVACLSPLSKPTEIDRAHEAATLMRSEAAALVGGRAGEKLFIDSLRRQAQREGWMDEGGMAGNLVGLLSQTYEATAGLIGNSIVALSQMPHLEEQVMQTENGWLRLVEEVSRFDSPVQNTRRFAAQPMTIEGIDLASGAAILLVLGAANRDPLVNESPDEFMLGRTAPRVYSYSRGAHACHGQKLAQTIAGEALAQLWLVRGSRWHRDLQWRYRPSVNGRLPQFFRHSAAGATA